MGNQHLGLHIAADEQSILVYKLESRFSVSHHCHTENTVTFGEVLIAILKVNSWHPENRNQEY